MPLKLRPAALADAPALTNILHRAKASWGYPRDKMADFMDHWGITASTIRSLQMTVAELDGVPVAFSGIALKDRETLLVDFLFVAPEVQGRGIGRLLLKRAEDVARARKLSRLYLESDTHAELYYEKHGFRTIATRPSDMSPGKDIPFMEKPLPPCVYEISKIDIELSGARWQFEVDHATEIAAHFEAAKKRIALLWNGRTLMLTQYAFRDGIFRGRCAESSYAAHLAWRDWGAPDATAFNLFGSAVIRSSDGALLYGVMADHTATAGLIYPPGGNLDPGDVTPDGKVDIAGAIDRELEEETGLTAATLSKSELLVAFDGPRISIAQVFESHQTAADLSDRMIAHARTSAEKELAEIRVLRSPADLHDPALVPYAREIADYLLPAANDETQRG